MVIRVPAPETSSIDGYCSYCTVPEEGAYFGGLPGTSATGSETTYIGGRYCFGVAPGFQGSSRTSPAASPRSGSSTATPQAMAFDGPQDPGSR